MPKVKQMTEEARRRERNAKRDDAFRACIGAIKAVTGMTNEEIGRKMMRISKVTMSKRVNHPGTLKLEELRLLIDAMPEGMKVPAEVIGL